jgi:hypothetical protein
VACFAFLSYRWSTWPLALAPRPWSWWSLFTGDLVALVGTISTAYPALPHWSPVLVANGTVPTVCNATCIQLRG